MARRLLLSYLALISLTVALLALIVQLTTHQTFSRYLSDQAAAHSEMLPVMLSGYYTERSSWDGVQSSVDQASLMIGAQVALAGEDDRIVAASTREWVGQDAEDKTEFELALPVLGSAGRKLGTVYVGRSLAQQRADQAFLASVTRALVSAGLLVALLSAALGVLLSRSISRPLLEVSQAANRVAQGDYNVRVSVKGRDELSVLANAFNRMAEGMAEIEKLRRYLVANISHDLRTPLTVLSGYLEGLLSGQIADRRSAELSFEAMQAEVQHLQQMVEALRQISVLDGSGRRLHRLPVHPATLVQDAVKRFTAITREKGIELVTDAPEDLPVVAVEQESLAQALQNLLENALHHTPTGGTITVSAGVAAHQTDTPTHVWIAVQDTGEGIPPDHLPYIFERFYRVEAARSREDGRTGLGLSIVKAVVEAQGGQVHAESEGVPGRGSKVTIMLPLS
jgi:signal transduction histidine kinase